MTATIPADPRVVEIDTRLTRLSHALAGARAAYRHSPNGDTERVLDTVRGDCDVLLDIRLSLRAG